MPKRTSVTDATKVDEASDLEHLVRDKRADWRASGAKARRRQRRYKKLLTRQISRQDYDGEDGLDDI
jgi:hypothetical protein